jgi:hypothetical protein
MSRYLKTLAIMTALAALLCVATPARADITVTVQEDSGTTFTFTQAGSPSANGGLGQTTSSFTLINPTGTFTTPNYTVEITSANESQDSSGSEVASSTLKITQTGATAGILHITVTGTGFTAPTTPPAVAITSEIGGSSQNARSTDTLVFQSFVAGTGEGLQNESSQLTSGSFKSTLNTSTNTLTAPFTVRQTVDIQLNGVGDNVGYQATTQLTQPTPAPPTLALAFSALPLVGWGVWRRRRQAKA